MIIQKEVNIGSRTLLHTYSDSNKYILQVETNTKYDEAYDIIPCRYTYIETEEEIEKGEEWSMAKCKSRKPCKKRK